jgi:hypothetical protein
MSNVRIQTGSIERIEALALDASLNPLTSLTDLLIAIRRVSDGYFFDFNDLTFKNVGWTTRQLAMTEISATNAAGEYYYNFNTATITNPSSNDTYEIRVTQSPGTTVKNLPQVGEIKVGQFVDKIDASISTRSVPGDAMDLITDAIDSNSVATSGANEIRDTILSDSTSFNGASIALIKSKTDNLPIDPASQSLVNTAITNAETNILAAITALNDLSIVDIQTALTNQGYTSARAIKLDFLDKAISALNDLDIADIQTALTNQGYSAARALLLDNLNNLNATITSVLSAIAALNDISIADVQTAMTNQGYTALKAILLNNLDLAISLVPGAVDLVLTAAHGVGSWQSGGASDWTEDEKKQIRDSLGVDGLKITSVGGKVQEILADTNETQSKLPVNNLMGSSVKTDKDDEIDSIKSTVEALPSASSIASAVWGAGTRTLTSFSNLIIDIWSYITRTLTAGTKDIEIDAIKNKTDNLPIDPTSETNATANKNAIIVEVNANEVKIDSVQTKLNTDLDVKVSTRAIPGDAMALTVAERNSIRAAIMAYVVNSNTLGLTVEQTLDLMRKILNNRLELSDGAASNWKLYDDNDISILLNYDITDKDGNTIFLEPVTPARRTRGL